MGASASDERRAAGEGVFFYRREEGPARTACRVCVFRQDAETLYVANIIPVDSGEFTDGEYNGIQRDFQKQVEKTGFPSLITGEKAALVLSARAQDKLMAFFRNANPSTGTMHPGDRRLWMEFLVTAHREGCFPDPEMFYQYLIEILRWERRVAESMALEVEFAKWLLRVERETRDGERRVTL